MKYLVVFEEPEYKLYMHKHKLSKKIYYGITKDSIKSRWGRGSGYKKCTKFGLAIQKYGWDSFDHIVLFDKLTMTQALIMEEAFVRIGNTTNSKFGYNTSAGGKTGNLSAEAKRKLQCKKMIREVIHLETLKVYENSKKASLDTGYKLDSIRRACNSKRYVLFNSHWMFFDEYKSMTEEEINAILEKKPKCLHKDNRKVICVETKITYENAREAQNSYPSTTDRCILCCCKKADPNRLRAGGVHWMFLEDYKNSEEEVINELLKQKQGIKASKPVINNLTGISYESISSASKATGVSEKTIRYSCNGKRRTQKAKGNWSFL